MKLKVAILSILALLAVPLGGVLAHDADMNTTVSSEASSQEQLQVKKQEIENKEQKKRQQLEANNPDKCELVKVSLEHHAMTIEATHEHRSTVYKGLTDRLSNLSVRLSDQGVNTTELDTAITQLSGLVVDFDTDFAIYQAEVKNATNLACIDANAFRSTTNTALSALRTSKADAQAIRQHINSEVKPVLQDLRAVLSSSESSETEIEGEQ